jgi:flavin-dependent dehydrogenase
MVSDGTGTNHDVTIIGGGPGGSTTGALLKKYAPDLRVVILEKAKFPRDHVGESQLPPISEILDEMGCWEKVEAADFPIKIGATFRWGQSPDLWDFEFLPLDEFRDEPRPAKFEGQRRQTAFQVDRAVYDEILLRHAEELGCDVREETKVTGVERDGDRVTGLRLADGSVITARHYIDASGHIGILRRAMDVETEVPTRLQNVAFWDYWENAEWAVEIGVGGTRVQVISIDFGWIWFIPLGPTRTSIGLICPAEYYKQCGRTPEELYHEALRSEPYIARLIGNATARGTVETTSDWSFIAERTVGGNWFLVGESAGFADPILAAGLTLTQTGAREAAYTILELDRGEHDAHWLTSSYDHNQRSRIAQHIRFADYWYAANGQFTDLHEHCREIARDAGLRLSPESAWRWLAQGGFANDFIGQAGIGGLDLAGVKQITQMFSDKTADWLAAKYNVFKLNLQGAEEEPIPIYDDGRITPTPCYVRGNRRLPIAGMYATLVEILREHSGIDAIHEQLTNRARASVGPQLTAIAVQHGMQALEVMVSDGWVTGKLNKKKPRLTLSTPKEGRIIHSHRDPE